MYMYANCMYSAFNYMLNVHVHTKLCFDKCCPNLKTYMYCTCTIYYTCTCMYMYNIQLGLEKRFEGSNLRLFAVHSKLNFSLQSFAAMPTLLFAHAH